MEKGFNQNEYINYYKKKNYKQFNVRMPIKETEEIEQFLKEKKINKTDFIRKAYEIAKIEFGEIEDQPRKIKFIYTKFNHFYFQYLDNENELEIISKLYFLSNYHSYNSVESLFYNVFNKNVSLENPNDFYKEILK